MQGSRKEVMAIQKYQQCFAMMIQLGYLMTTDLSAIHARVSRGVMRLGGGGGGVRGVGHPGAGGQHEAGQGRLPRAGRVGGEARPHHVRAWARGRSALVTVTAGHRVSETWAHQHMMKQNICSDYDKSLLNCIDTDLIIQLLTEVT